jgi:hypothetical protein
MKKISLLLLLLMTFSIGFTQNKLVERKKSYDLHIANANKAMESDEYNKAQKSLRKAMHFTDNDKEISKLLTQIQEINIQGKSKAKEEERKNNILKENNTNEKETAELPKLKYSTSNLHNDLIHNEIFTKRKKVLYKAYKKLYNHLNKIKDSHERYVYLKDLKNLQLNINYLDSELTSKLSKEVKKIKEIEEIWKVIKLNMPEQFPN